MTGPFGREPPPDPKPNLPLGELDLTDAPAQIRVAGFLLGAALALVAGFAVNLLLCMICAAFTLQITSPTFMIIFLLAGVLKLALAVRFGRRLWADRMKGTAVGLIVAAALWCALDVTCGTGYSPFLS